MWIFVTINFSSRSKQKREQKDVFIRELVKDGFSKLYASMYVRYCTSLANAMTHRKRIMEKILPFGHVSIMLVADQQANLSYHFCGQKQNQKIEPKLPEIPKMIEFF